MMFEFIFFLSVTKFLMLFPHNVCKRKQGKLGLNVIYVTKNLFPCPNNPSHVVGSNCQWFFVSVGGSFQMLAGITRILVLMFIN